MKRLLCILALLCFTLPTLASCNTGRGTEPQSTEFYEYFDTVSIVQSYLGDSKESFNKNCALVRGVLEKYHRLFDIYYEYSGINNLRTVNRNAGKAPVKVDGELIDFLLYCKDMYTLTRGETNIAIGAVTKIWHDKRESAIKSPATANLPTDSELIEASEHTSIDLIVINEEDSTVYLSDPKASIDVGAIGKGYAAEMAKKVLIDAGVTSYVLNIGGNICCIGNKANGDKWRTAIKDPLTSGAYALTVYLSDITCVTSGSYQRYFTVDGVNYHHLIDKDTLMPSVHFTSVTVFCESSALADALSTALFCMTYEEGLSLVSTLEDVDVFWIAPDGAEYMTEGVCEFINK